MANRTGISSQTQRNWLIDAVLFLGGLLAALSGVYFLCLPSGGYQGGRNPMYGVTVLFGRTTWDALHTWAGLLMIGAVAIHLAVHWSWVVMMGKRSMDSLRSGRSKLSRRAQLNVALNALLVISFLVTAGTGIYFLFAPSGGEGLSHNVALDLVHTWAGVVLTVAAVAHLAIHWRWVKNVTRRLVQPLWTQPRRSESPAEA